MLKDLARALLRAACRTDVSDPVVLDNFTAALDRDTAMQVSVGVSHFVRKYGGQLVLVSAHEDVCAPLQPDWHYDTAGPSAVAYKRSSTPPASLATGGALRLDPSGADPVPELSEQLLASRPSGSTVTLRAPELEVTVRRVDKSFWRLFRDHHYKSASFLSHSECYAAFLGVEPIAFLALARGGVDDMKLGANSDVLVPKDKLIREHRMVVLPAFQGLGLASRIVEVVALAQLEKGVHVFSKTKAQQYGAARDRSPWWEPTTANHKKKQGAVTYSHIFKGGDHQDLRRTRVLI
jgi:GNAT superfamily N-acetyltransferase